MRIENGMLVLERKNCTRCNCGVIANVLPCPTCNGTGNGKRGKIRGCKTCYGSGNKYDWDNPVECPDCHGDFENHEPENYTDSIKDYSMIPLQVVRSNREQTFVEAYLGAGLYSVTDYGRSAEMSDEELLDSVRDEVYRRTQGSKLVRNKNDLRVCESLAIFTNSNGYSIIPVFPED